MNYDLFAAFPLSHILSLPGCGLSQDGTAKEWCLPSVQTFLHHPGVPLRIQWGKIRLPFNGKLLSWQPCWLYTWREQTQGEPGAACSSLQAWVFMCQSSESAFVPFKAALNVESMFSIMLVFSNCICNVHFSLVHSRVLLSLSSCYFAWKALTVGFTDTSLICQVTLGYKSDLWLLYFALQHSYLIWALHLCVKM